MPVSRLSFSPLLSVFYPSSAVMVLVSTFRFFTIIFYVISNLSVLVRAPHVQCLAVLFIFVFSLSVYLHVSMNEINGDLSSVVSRI